MHAEIQPQENIGRLKNRLLHHAYRDLDDYFKKLLRYTPWGAEKALRKGMRGNIFHILFLPGLEAAVTSAIAAASGTYDYDFRIIDGGLDPQSLEGLRARVSAIGRQRGVAASLTALPIDQEGLLQRDIRCKHKRENRE
ncbi:hypothetical protein ACFL4W_05830 [Planctomycetota bacterium]